MEKKQATAAIYIRTVPLLDQEQEDQLAIVQSYAKLNGYHVIGYYHDKSFGGVNERRPSLEKMLIDAKTKNFDIALVFSLDKIFRHSKHMVSIINDLTQAGVGLISICDRFDSSSDKSKELLHSVIQIISLDRQTQNERIRIGIAQKRLASERTGFFWQIGRPQINNELIQQIIELRNQGLSIRAIERRLKRSVSKTTIGRIVKNIYLRSIKEN